MPVVHRRRRSGRRSPGCGAPDRRAPLSAAAAARAPRAIRASGGTPVARDGRTVLASVSHSRNCRSRSSRSRKRRCLKNEPFTQPTRFSTAAFLLRPIGPAHFHAEAEIEGHARKGRIPVRDDAIASPRQRHRLRPIEDRHQRDAAKRGEMIDQGAHQRLDPLIGDHRHLDPARVFQARGKEVHLRPRCHPDSVTHTSPKSCCENSAGYSFKPHQRRHRVRAERPDQRVERTLAARVAGLPRPVQQLHRSQRRDPPSAPARMTSRYASAFDGRPIWRRRALRAVIDRRDRRFRGDAADASGRRPR